MKCLVRAIFVFCIGILLLSAGVASAQDLAVGNYTLISKQRVSRTEYNYTYQADITNIGPDVQNVTAFLTSNSAYTTVVDGELIFGDVASGSSAISTDSFTIKQNRRYPLNWSDLVWDIHYTANPSVPPSIIDNSELHPFETQGRLTVQGDLIEGSGLKVTLSGPTETLVLGQTYWFTIKIEPGDSWTTDQNYQGFPTAIFGSGISQLLVLFDSDDITMGNPILKIDGITRAEEYVLGIISLTHMGVASDVEGAIFGTISELIEQAAAHWGFSFYEPTGYIEFETPTDLQASEDWAQIRSIIGGSELFDYSYVDNVELSLPVTFQNAGAHSITFVPDVRFEVHVIPPPGITSDFYAGSEYRREIVLRVSVDCHKFDTDCDGCINNEEVIVAIEKWKAGEISIVELIEAITIWKKCTSANTLSDDFEDGVIDSSLWVTGDAKRGWNPSNLSDTGNWDYSHEEITDPIDGYLNMRVWGPTSGNTYGAEAWVRTSTDFNDSANHIINFTWEPEFIDYHYNLYFIQVTDGYISPGTLSWARHSDYAGTVNLLWDSEDARGWQFDERLDNVPSPGKLQYSITIDPSGVARLYDSPNATGTIIYESALDLAYPWYVRFMVSDGTSAGFPAGDARLKLYDFSSVIY